MLRIIPLGGMGTVTQNMYVYEYGDEMLIIDCGIGFPDSYMPGVDVLIPDVTYVMEQLEKGKRIVGMILSHGHDDHIAATGYLFSRLPKFPVYGSPLTAAFAETRMKDGGVNTQVQVVKTPKVVEVSPSFKFQLIPVTHSVPDTRHVVVHTPEGIIYHGSDFKLDEKPVDGVVTDFETMKEVAKNGIECMLVDCLRVERDERTSSETTVGPHLLEAMQDTKGKIVVTLMSSHIHRIQQTIDAAEQLGRKVAFVGRSVEQNVKTALELKKLTIPKGMQISKKEIGSYPDNKLVVIIAGSQGQEGSSLMRAVYGDHRAIQIKQQDTVIFSADAIPGNELNFYGAIDELSKNRVHVLYPEIMPGLHASGHASSLEQRELVEVIQPKYLLPIGGADRHRYLFLEKVAEPLNYAKEQVLLPDAGEVITFSNGTAGTAETITLRPQVVDGLGIGDVGPVVLSDRRTLGQAGIVVVVLYRNETGFDLSRTMVVSRGFIFMKQAEEVVEFIEQAVAEIVESLQPVPKDEELLRAIEKRLSRKLYKIIRREPMIVPVILEGE